MKSGVLILLLLILIIQSHFGYCKTDFSFFYFTQQWPGSRCNTRNKFCYPPTGKPETNFIIQRFQPVKYRAKNPMYCNYSEPEYLLNKYEIENITESLTKHWPSLNCPSKDIINNCIRQWAQFGSCSNLHQHTYFKTALHFKKRLKLLKILEDNGIIPNGESYEFNNIRSAISNATGFVPLIFCNEDINGYHQLLEVSFCVERSGLHLKSCPKFKTDMSKKYCGETTKFPSF